MTDRRTMADRIETLERRMDAMERSGVKNTKAVASDGMLDGPYGDPLIGRQEPNDWHGKSFIGYRMSDCDANYLDLYAEMKERFAANDDLTQRRDGKGRLTAGFKRTDATLARGWALRIRSGWKPSDGRLQRTHPQFQRDMQEIEEAEAPKDDRSAVEKFVEDADDEIPF